MWKPHPALEELAVRSVGSYESISGEYNILALFQVLLSHSVTTDIGDRLARPLGSFCTAILLMAVFQNLPQ